MDDKNDNHIQFLPFHALNQFMVPEFRAEVVRMALRHARGAPRGLNSALEGLTRRYVQVPGFRNSAKAPAQVRLKPTLAAFEKERSLVAAVLALWADALPQVCQQVDGLLRSRPGWELLPLEADRTKLPGFLPTWPAGEDFDIIYQAYQEQHPDDTATHDEVSLMAVWLGGRLPLEEEAGDDSGDEQGEGVELAGGDGFLPFPEAGEGPGVGV